MKILLDTNIYLDFYRAKNEPLSLIKEILDNTDLFILTDQIIDEFDRSRELVIKKVINKFNEESNLGNFSSAIVDDFSDFKKLVEYQKKYNLQRKKVQSLLTEMKTDITKDKVGTFFRELVSFHKQKDSVYRVTDDIISSAQKRKLMGNPPQSEKYSIGDEINWETVLANIQEDLVIVGRDKTFVNNESFLKKDFHANTGYELVGVYGTIAAAMAHAGRAISAASIDEEKATIAALHGT